MKYILILAFLLFSCEAYKKNVISQRMMADFGVVTEVNTKYGYYTVYWKCQDQRGKNQFCGGISDHLLKENIEVGDTVRILTTPSRSVLKN